MQYECLKVETISGHLLYIWFDFEHSYVKQKMNDKLQKSPWKHGDCNNCILELLIIKIKPCNF